MSDWEDAECLLCGSPAKRYVFVDPCGQKYDRCEGGCPPYAVRGILHEEIRLFIKNADDKTKLIEFIKAETARGSQSDAFFEILPDHLRNLGLILK